MPLGAIGMLLLAGWSSAAMAWSRAPDPPLLAWASGAIALAVSPLATRRSIAELMAILVAAGSSLMVIGEAALGHQALHGGHGNPNWLGLTVATALPLLVARLARAHAERRAERWPLALCTAAAIATLAVSASHTAWIALAVATVVMAPGRARWLALLPCAAMAIAHRGVCDALAGRLWIWRASWRAALDGLPLGHGTGSFAFAYLDAQAGALRALPYERAAHSFVNATSAHQDWLQLLVEGGPIALVLCGAVLVSAFVSLRRRFPAGAASVLVVMVSALGDAPLEQPAVMALLGTVLALTPTVRVRASDKMLRWLAVAAIACTLPIAVRSWLATRLVSRARDDVDGRVALLEDAARIDPRSGEAALELGLARLERGSIDGALEELERSRALLANVGTDVAIGNAHMQRGARSDAIAAYRRALSLHPALFRAHANLAEALRAEGDLDEAERHLHAALELMPHHPKLTQIAEQLRRDRIDAATR